MPFGFGNKVPDDAPPGSLGWPFLGEALSYRKSPHEFIESRAKKYGSVFKTRILGSTVVCFVGPEPFSFFVDNPHFKRADAAPRHVRELLCQRSLPLIDGATHGELRGKVQSMLSPDAVDAYLSTTAKIFGRYIERWEQLGTFAWEDEYKRFCAAACSALLLGSGSDFDADAGLAHLLDRFLAGLTAFPINLPFTTYGRAIRSRDQLLSVIDDSIAARHQATHDDMLSRLLASQLSGDELRAQMVHLFFAMYGGLHRALALMCLELAQHPEAMARARQEVAAGASGDQLDIETLVGLRYIDAVTREVRRHNRMFASNFFETATEDVTYNGYRVPKGWKATGVIFQTMQDESVFAQPEAFNPDRFTGTDRRYEQVENSYIPHGGGALDGHRCPAEDFATLFMQQTAAMLLRGHTWTLVPGQDMSLTGGPSPMPRDGIRVEFRRRAG